MRFEPEGITGNPEIPFAKSMPDYIMRWLASRFLDTDAQEELGILTPEVRARKAAQDDRAGRRGVRHRRPADGEHGRRTPQASGGRGDGGSRAAGGPHRLAAGGPGAPAGPRPRPRVQPVRRDDAADGLVATRAHPAATTPAAAEPRAAGASRRPRSLACAGRETARRRASRHCSALGPRPLAPGLSQTTRSRLRERSRSTSGRRPAPGTSPGRADRRARAGRRASTPSRSAPKPRTPWAAPARSPIPGLDCWTCRSTLHPLPRAPAGRLPVRGGPLRDHRAVPVGRLLPLHPLPAPHGHRLLGQRPRPAGRLPAARREPSGCAPSSHPTGVPKLFCATCGSALFSGEPFSDEEVAVRLGTLDRDPGSRRSTGSSSLGGLLGADRRGRPDAGGRAPADATGRSTVRGPAGGRALRECRARTRRHRSSARIGARPGLSRGPGAGAGAGSRAVLGVQALLQRARGGEFRRLSTRRSGSSRRSRGCAPAVRPGG